MLPTREGCLSKDRCFAWKYVFVHILKHLESERKGDYSCIGNISSSQWCITMSCLWLSGRFIVFIIISNAPQTWTFEKPKSSDFPVCIVGIQANHFMFINIQLLSVEKIVEFHHYLHLLSAQAKYIQKGNNQKDTFRELNCCNRDSRQLLPLQNWRRKAMRVYHPLPNVFSWEERNSRMTWLC